MCAGKHSATISVASSALRSFGRVIGAIKPVKSSVNMRTINQCLMEINQRKSDAQYLCVGLTSIACRVCHYLCDDWNPPTTNIRIAWRRLSKNSGQRKAFTAFRQLVHAATLIVCERPSSDSFISHPIGLSQQ